MGQILHQVPQALPDMLKLIDSSIVQIVGMQDLLNQLRLSPDLRDVGHAGHAADLFHQILACLLIGLSHQIGKFDAIHQCIKPHGAGLICVRLEQRRHFLFQMKRIFIAEGLVALRIGKLFYVFQMLLDREIAPVQLLYFGKHLPHQLLPEGDQLLGLVGQILELIDNLGFQIENRTLQSHLIGGSLALVHAEEFEVSAEVEDVEFFLILAVHQSRAQPGAPSYHLPELGLAHHLFEEYQVQHLRHIDAGVQHVYGDGDLRQLFRVGELVDGTLGVGHVVVDNLGVARQMGILFTEHF